MQKLDVTLDDVQNTCFENGYHDLIMQMPKQTQFNQIEVGCILMVYYKFALLNEGKPKHMTKKQFVYMFKELFQICDLQIIERILAYITNDQVKEVDPVAWVKLFAVFMSNNLEQKMRFAFQIYNTQGTGFINRDVVNLAVDKFFTGDDEDEINELKSDMVDLIFRKFDVDKDGFISYEDYSAVVLKQPLYLEFLGTCLPPTNRQTVIAYCANIMSKIKDENE